MSEKSPGTADADRGPGVAGAGRKGLGIAHRLFVVLALTAILPLLVTGGWMVRRSGEEMRRSVREVQRAVLADVSRTVDGWLLQAQDELLTSSELLLGDGPMDSQTRLEMTLARMRSHEAFESLILYGPDGTSVQGIQLSEVSQDPSAPLDPALRQTLEQNAWAVGPVTPGLKAPVLTLVVRYRQGERLLGYLAGTLSLEPLCQTLADIQEQSLNPSGDLIYLVDGDQRMIAHPAPDQANLLENRTGRGLLRVNGGKMQYHVRVGNTQEYEDVQGRSWVGALQSLDTMGWAVVVEQPGDVVFASIHEMQRTLWVGALLAVLVLIGVAGVVAGRVTRPVRELVQAIQKLGGREFQARVEVTRTDELGTLAEAFNGMAGDLEASELRLEKERTIRANLSRFLAPEVVESLIQHPERMKLGGERRVASVMFADICDFTAIAEQLEPEVLVTLLNELFGIATEIIMRHGGIVDKFLGDCIMAVFGVPEHSEDHARRAVLAAEDLMRWLEAGNRRWEKAYGLQMRLSIGIHSGPVVAGNIGSEKRMDYTVIGDSVNIASRLQALASPGQILVSEATRVSIGDDFECEAAGLHTVSGRSGATLVFSITQD